MRDHDHRFVLPLTERFDDVLNQTTVGVVKTVQGLIEDEQTGVLDKGTGKENEALLTAGELQERSFFQSFQTENPHPLPTDLIIFFRGLYI